MRPKSPSKGPLRILYAGEMLGCFGYGLFVCVHFPQCRIWEKQYYSQRWAIRLHVNLCGFPDWCTFIWWGSDDNDPIGFSVCPGTNWNVIKLKGFNHVRVEKIFCYWIKAGFIFRAKDRTMTDSEHSHCKQTATLFRNRENERVARLCEFGTWRAWMCLLVCICTQTTTRGRQFTPAYTWLTLSYCKLKLWWGPSK